MDDFLKMDVFFIVTTLAVVLVTGLIAYAVYRFIKVLEVLERIAQSAEVEAHKLQEDLEHFRTKIRKKGITLRSVVKFLGGSNS
ncbi:hypothetical protein K2Y00_00920 [Patescibacteria group bacterium]|nr:hypothetical protein [Patescibacteria group bacterium]